MYSPVDFTSLGGVGAWTKLCLSNIPRKKWYNLQPDFAVKDLYTERSASFWPRIFPGSTLYEALISRLKQF
jgi:hypothetical protein